MTDLAVNTENGNTGQKGTLTIVAGYDLGNSSIKFVSSDRQIRFPSYLENLAWQNLLEKSGNPVILTL